MDAVKVIKKSGAPGAVPAVTAYVDEPLLPKVSAYDSGKVIGVDEHGELDAITIESGGKVYCHSFYDSNYMNHKIVFYSSKSTQYTLAELNAILKDGNFTSTTYFLGMGTGYNMTADGKLEMMRGIYASGNYTYIYVMRLDNTFSASYESLLLSASRVSRYTIFEI